MQVATSFKFNNKDTITSAFNVDYKYMPIELVRYNPIQEKSKQYYQIFLIWNLQITLLAAKFDISFSLILSRVLLN